jgi:hypothetical protein
MEDVKWLGRRTVQRGKLARRKEYDRGKKVEGGK